MKIPFDKVIVSSNDNPKFINFWPLVSKTWKKFFPEIEVDLCFVTNRSLNDSFVLELKKYGNVYLYKQFSNIPAGNLGKVCRLYHASKQKNLVVSIHDIDSIPLQKNYLIETLKHRLKEHLCLIGSEYYSGVDSGKCPMVPTTAEGYIFDLLLQKKNNSWEEFIENIKNIHVYDKKESILASDDPISYPDNHFSDESLVRVFRKTFNGNIQLLRRDVARPLNPKTDWIDRSNFNYDITKLYQGFYTECNMPRPLDLNIMKDIIKYINT